MKTRTGIKAGLASLTSDVQPDKADAGTEDIRQVRID